MARELAGKFAIGNGRGEISQVGELKLMASKLHPFCVSNPDAEPAETEYVVDPKDKISTKEAISITAMSGRNGLTRVQYECVYELCQVLLQSAVVIVTAILTQFYLSTFQVPVPPHLISWMTASLMRLQPLYHRSHFSRLLNESFENLKVRGRLVVFFETVGDKKIKKRKRKKRKKRVPANVQKRITASRQWLAIRSSSLGDIQQLKLFYPGTSYKERFPTLLRKLNSSTTCFLTVIVYRMTNRGLFEILVAMKWAWDAASLLTRRYGRRDSFYLAD